MIIASQEDVELAVDSFRQLIQGAMERGEIVSLSVSNPPVMLPSSGTVIEYAPGAVTTTTISVHHATGAYGERVEQ